MIKMTRQRLLAASAALVAPAFMAMPTPAMAAPTCEQQANIDCAFGKWQTLGYSSESECREIETILRCPPDPGDDLSDPGNPAYKFPDPLPPPGGA